MPPRQSRLGPATSSNLLRFALEHGKQLKIDKLDALIADAVSLQRLFA